MFEVGRMCVKIAGRDAGKKCVIVDVLENNFVMIDGQTRRRKCNLKHLEPMETMVKLKKGASNSEVEKELTALKIEVRKTKPKKTAERPRKIRKAKEKPVKEVKKAIPKKAVEKETPKKAVGAPKVKEEKPVKKDAPKVEAKTSEKKTTPKKE